MRFPRLLATTSAIALLIGAALAAPVAAASTTVECGQISGYTAPDPSGPTDGSLTIGLMTPWVIAPDATVSAAVAANLPNIVNSAPSCLTVDFDDGGIITAMDFAPEGDISGSVVFDSGFDGYIFDQRLLVPTFVTDQYPGLEAIFATSAAAGTDATVTFTVDVTTGVFTGIDARAAFCGKAHVKSNGDGVVGKATIPASVLDATDTSRLKGAGSRNTCASVRSQGTPDPQTGNIALTTNVTIKVAAAGVTLTPPPTSTITVATAPVEPRSPLPFIAIFALVIVAVGASLQRTRDRR